MEQPVVDTPSGSGDTLFYYVQLLGIILLALVGFIVWTLLDNKRKNYDSLFYWAMVLVRYSLAATLIGYGFAKIYKTQFLFPAPSYLFTPLWQSSPMGLVWKFMGYSTGYNYFTGFAEALGGVLLLFRRTATFGALLGFGVMANIVAINFFYDVPVKIFSSHLLFMALFVAAPDLKRLFTFFFLNNPVPAATLAAPDFQKKWMHQTHFWLKLSLLCYFGYSTIVMGYQQYKSYTTSITKAPLHGAFQVTTFILNGDTLPPLTTDTIRWKLFLVNNENSISARIMNDSVQRLKATVDTTQKSLSWYSPLDSTQTSSLRYYQTNSNLLTLRGHLNKDSVKIDLRKIDLRKLPLARRGFHWVNEVPYNR
ncbi:hypothetical protein [Rufibacter hautae]|uniref:DoxX family protein n=1 Tax=Rufibacter hautae TaxID=2595005 RepID=A0A5B6TE36_9BACT|nr:hypothetical protein [Rufibacter hautae]KAA3438426.1 hypothetical protein FOA19_14405 [Rufibacter hautae]